MFLEAFNRCTHKKYMNRSLPITVCKSKVCFHVQFSLLFDIYIYVFNARVRYYFVAFHIMICIIHTHTRTLEHPHYLIRTASKLYRAECVSIFNVMNTSSSPSSSMFRIKFIQNSKQMTLLFVDQNKLDGLCLELFKKKYTNAHTNTYIRIV